MTKVSRIPLTKEELDRLITAFWRVLSVLRTPRDIETLLAGFLTHTEVKMFAKRLQIAKMLLVKKSYADISRTLKVTAVPIMRINNLLHDNKSFRAMIQKF